MGLSVADAYNQIKNLENSGQLNLPKTQETIEVGTVDPKAGTFTWSVPTLTQTTTLPPGPGQKTNRIINVTVGVVSTKAVDLLLKFAVIPQRIQVSNAPVSSGPVATRMAIAVPAAKETLTAQAQAATVKTISPVILGGLTTETNGGVTITGFPTVSSQANEITVDAGLVCSTVMNNVQNTSPAVTNFAVTINIPGHNAVYLNLFILRPPVVGMGAFTIPALPMTIVYAPPQGKLLKNSASYSETATITRTITSSITSSNNTKTVQAYTAADLISKVASAITAVAAVVGTGGAGASGGASVAGALQQLGSALFGPAKDANDSTADATKQVSSELTLISDIVTAVDASAPASDTNIQTTQTDHTLTLTVTNMSQFSSASGLGPGVGDRIIYLSNVKVVWMAVNGEVGINILGYDGTGENAVNDLIQEQKILASGGQPTLGLDAATIKSLLSLDPMVGSSQIAPIHLGPPRVGPPRFVPANPPERKGSGTGSSGDTFVASFEVATDDKQTITNTQTTITDAKPGWAAVLFGADNTETTTTSTWTTSQSVDNKTDDKITSTITLVSEGLDDPYDVKIFYDCTFGTYAILNSDSPLLQGIIVVNRPVLEPVK